MIFSRRSVTASRDVDALTAVRRLVARPALLSLVVQPVVDLRTGRVAGHEALTRVPDDWGVPTEALFAAARDGGSSAALTRDVVGRVLGLLDDAAPGTFVAVNIDPPDLLDGTVTQALFRRADLRGLVVEVTEHAWPDAREQVDRILDGLRGRGARIAADDVGAGYSGLSQLMRIRPDLVKVNRELVAGIADEPAAEQLLRALVALCSSLGARVVVEGVEDERQLAVLLRCGVPLAQGYLFGRPADPWPEVDASGLLAGRVVADGPVSTVAALAQPVDETYYRDDLGDTWRLGAPRPSVVVGPTTTVAEAMNRAVGRPADQRWVPLVVVDDEGAPTGLVTVESLALEAVRQH